MNNLTDICTGEQCNLPDLNTSRWRKDGHFLYLSPLDFRTQGSVIVRQDSSQITPAYLPPL